MSRGKKYIAWIGLFQKQKNLPQLLKIALELPDYDFCIAGKQLNNHLDHDIIDAINKLKEKKSPLVMYPIMEW